MSLYKSGDIKFLWIVLAVVLVVVLVFGAWQLSSRFPASVFNVGATVKAPSTEITQVTPNRPGLDGTEYKGSEPGSGPDGTEGKGSEPEPGSDGTEYKGSEPGAVPDGSEGKGSEPGSGPGGSPSPVLVQIGDKGNLIFINTDIIYGTVFPGENITGYFIVELAQVVDNVTYSVNMTAKSGDKDMTPYLTAWKDTSETDTEPDYIAEGPKGDYDAEGTLDANATPADTSDKWFVRFDVPVELGDYGAEIKVSPEEKTEIGP